MSVFTASHFTSSHSLRFTDTAFERAARLAARKLFLPLTQHSLLQIWELCVNAQGHPLSLWDTVLLSQLRELTVRNAALLSFEALKTPLLEHFTLQRTSWQAGERIPPLPRLRSLMLCQNRLHDFSCAESLGALARLASDKNPVETLATLRALPALRSLRLWNSEKSLSDFSPLTALSALTELELGALPGLFSLDFLPPLKCLAYFVLRDCAGVTAFPKGCFLPALTYLELSNIQVRTIDFVRGMPQLTALRLEGTEIRDLSPLMELHHLQEITLKSNPYLTDCPALKKLSPSIKIYYT